MPKNNLKMGEDDRRLLSERYLVDEILGVRLPWRSLVSYYKLVAVQPGKAAECERDTRSRRQEHGIKMLAMLNREREKGATKNKSQS